MPEFALQTYPSKQVCFEGEKLGSEPVSAVIEITNTTSKTVAWKVKCTSNEMFRILPPVGMLAPRESHKVTVIFEPGKEIPKHSKHYFVVYYISAKDDLSAKKPPRQLWAENANTVPEGCRRLYVAFKNQSPAAVKTKETKKDDGRKDEIKKADDKEEDKKAAEEGKEGNSKEKNEHDGDRKDSRAAENKEDKKEEKDSKKNAEPADDKKDRDADEKGDDDKKDDEKKEVEE